METFQNQLRPFELVVTVDDPDYPNGIRKRSFDALDVGFTGDFLTVKLSNGSHCIATRLVREFVTVASE